MRFLQQNKKKNAQITRKIFNFFNWNSCLLCVCVSVHSYRFNKLLFTKTILKDFVSVCCLIIIFSILASTHKLTQWMIITPFQFPLLLLFLSLLYIVLIFCCCYTDKLVEVLLLRLFFFFCIRCGVSVITLSYFFGKRLKRCRAKWNETFQTS